jgi:DNA-binding MarR family transcriptional regulator
MPRLALVREPATPPAPPSANPRWALERAIRTAGIPASAKLILYTLLTYLGPDSLDLGRWSPGTRRLSVETSMNVHTISRHLAALEEHGWIVKRARKGRRTEYVLSAGRAYADRAGQRKPPTDATKSISDRTAPKSRRQAGDATKSISGDATKSISGDVTRGITVIPMSDQSEQSKGAGEDFLSAQRLARNSPADDQPASKTPNPRGDASGDITSELRAILADISFEDM